MKRPIRKQPRKDSKTKRVNFDNERISKFDRNEVDEKCGKANDVAWYARNSELLQSAASLGFSSTTGLPDSNGVIVPGVMQIPFVASLGGTNNTAVIMQAANSIYSYVVHQNSRNISYDANDMMMIIHAGKEVFTAIANLIRVYGLMLKSNQENFYQPQAIVKACGLDYADCKANFERMLFDINDLISESRQIWVPNTMPVFTRQFWMATNVYQDSESVKGQYYVYVPASLRKLNEQASSSLPSLLTQVKEWNVINGMTWNVAVSAVRSCIESLMNSQYRGVIFGDILKAYGEANLFKISFVDLSYTVTPSYDKEVLTQIENLSFRALVSAERANPQLWVSEFHTDANSGQIVETYGSAVSSNAIASDAWNCFPQSYHNLNFHFQGQPTAADIMVATRLAAMNNFVATGPNVSSPTTIVSILPQYCGTEWCAGLNIIQLTSSSSMNVVSMYPRRYSTYTADVPAASYAVILNSVALTAAFDWAPWITLGTQSGQSATSIGSWVTTGYVADVDNYLIVDVNNMYRMHKTAILSEYGVPVLK